MTFSAAGLVLGTAIQPQQLGLLFSVVLTPGTPHMPLAAVVVRALAVRAVLFSVLGVRGSRKRAFG